MKMKLSAFVSGRFGLLFLEIVTPPEEMSPSSRAPGRKNSLPNIFGLLDQSDFDTGLYTMATYTCYL